MTSLEIEGGVPLHGEVELSGAKNAALPLMAAAILTRGKVVLHRVPHLADIETMIKVLGKLGVAAEWSGREHPGDPGRGRVQRHRPIRPRQADARLDLRAGAAARAARMGARRASGRMRHRPATD